MDSFVSWEKASAVHLLFLIKVVASIFSTMVRWRLNNSSKLNICVRSRPRSFGNQRRWLICRTVQITHWKVVDDVAGFQCVWRKHATKTMQFTSKITCESLSPFTLFSSVLCISVSHTTKSLKHPCLLSSCCGVSLCLVSAFFVFCLICRYISCLFHLQALLLQTRSIKNASAAGVVLSPWCFLSCILQKSCGVYFELFVQETLNLHVYLRRG